MSGRSGGPAKGGAPCRKSERSGDPAKGGTLSGITASKPKTLKINPPERIIRLFLQFYLKFQINIPYLCNQLFEL